MPSLSGLFGINAKALNTTPRRMGNLPPPPVEPEWDIRSGEPEPGLGRVTPEEWLPPGAGMKLASLAKGSASLLAAGIMKPKGGVWNTNSLLHQMKLDAPPDITSGIQEYFETHASRADRIQARADAIAAWGDAGPKYSWDLVDRIAMVAAIRRHYKDPSYMPFLANAPQVVANKWARGPLKNYITRDMATEGDPIRALAEEGITHLDNSLTKRMPAHSQSQAWWTQESTPQARTRMGFPEGETAKTKLGRIWERIADSKVIPGKDADEYGNAVYEYGLGAIYSGKLDDGLQRLRGIVEDGIRRGNINPGSVARGNFTVADAVKYADKERRIAEKNALSPDVFKEYPETGHKWVQLNKPGQFSAESDAMKHSVRGYEPTSAEGSSYGLGGFPAIESGKAKIFSLRDASGKPSVTVEIEALPDGSHRVVQVKGRANTAPKPEYSQMIEDLKRQLGQ